MQKTVLKIKGLRKVVYFLNSNKHHHPVKDQISQGCILKQFSYMKQFSSQFYEKRSLATTCIKICSFFLNHYQLHIIYSPRLPNIFRYIFKVQS